jgi:hypothetical protein
MKDYRLVSAWVILTLLMVNQETPGRGFGGFRGGGGNRGGFGGGGFRGGESGGFRGGYSGESRGGEGGNRGGYGGYRGGEGGNRGGYASSGYGRSVEGARGAATGARGSYAGAARPAATAARFPTDGGLAHYANVNGAAASHMTHPWSNGYMANRANLVRGGWNHWDCFGSGWWTNHPGAWGYGIGWVNGNAWATANWANLASWWGYSSTPVYYDYGTNVVYQGDNVYVDGTDAGSAQQYTEQAANIAAQGSQTDPPATEKWQSLGVFALVQGDETTSNTMFQLAVDQQGTLRGNYYDALMDSTTPVNGAVDKKTQRAAWTIGDKKNVVFDTGIVNLTKDKTPVLVHSGKDKTQQWLLVRLSKPDQK